MSGRNLKLTHAVIVVLVVCLLLLCLVGFIVDRSGKTRLQPFPGPGKLLFATWDPTSSEWQVHQLEAGLQAAQMFSFPAEGDYAWQPRVFQYEDPIIVSPAGDMAVFAPGILVNLRTGEHYNLGITYGPKVGNRYASPAAFSPDGERLAFVRAGALYVLKLNPFTPQSEKLLYECPCDFYERMKFCVQIAGPVWLNEDTVIFSHGTLGPVVWIGAQSDPFPPDTIAVMDYSGRLRHEYQYTWPDSGDFQCAQQPIGIVQTQDGQAVQINVKRPAESYYGGSIWVYVEDVLRGIYEPFYPEKQPSTPTLRTGCIAAPDGASMACLDYSKVGSEFRPALTIVDTSATTSLTVLRWEKDEWDNLHLVTWWP